MNLRPEEISSVIKDRVVDSSIKTKLYELSKNLRSIQV